MEKHGVVSEEDSTLPPLVANAISLGAGVLIYVLWYWYEVGQFCVAMWFGTAPPVIIGLSALTLQSFPANPNPDHGPPKPTKTRNRGVAHQSSASGTLVDQYRGRHRRLHHHREGDDSTYSGFIPHPQKQYSTGHRICLGYCQPSSPDRFLFPCTEPYSQQTNQTPNLIRGAPGAMYCQRDPGGSRARNRAVNNPFTVAG